MTKAHLWRCRTTQPQLPHANGFFAERRSSPSRRIRNRYRFKKHLSIIAVRASLRSIFQDSFIDKDRSEIVSLKDSATVDVIRGEVLRSPRYSRTFRLDGRS